MASRNQYQRDPALAQAFNNLSQMFAPPSGSDMAGYATANAKKAEAQRLADLFAYSKDPNWDKNQFDRQLQAAGLATPSTGYYGVDTTAATSRANNSADNARALQQTQMQQSGETTRTMLGPVAAGATRFVPPTIASLYQTPETQVGVIESKPGEIATLPDGRVIAGAAKPLSTDELAAKEQQRLTASGQITDQQLVDNIIGQRAPVQALDPNGKPVFQSPGAAIRQGSQPFVQSGATRRVDGTAIVNGRQIPVTRSPDGLAWQMQDGQPLPPDARVMDMPKATGTLDQLGVPTTANNTAANNQAAEVTRALGILDMYEQLIGNNPGVIGLSGMIRGTAQNIGASVQDLAKSFGDKAPQLADAAQSVQSGLKGVAPEMFDPAIPQAEFLQGTLAYALARTENPSGEVSRQAYDRALDRVRGGGLLANSAAAKAAIAANRQVLQTQLQGISTLRGQQPGRTDPGFTPPPEAPRAAPEPGAVERWGRDPKTGKMMRMQ